MGMAEYNKKNYKHRSLMTMKEQNQSQQHQENNIRNNDGYKL